mmetsp:Transcript_15679/g.30617  ORF Transcript_15679/g.30617 Transcript_15679/m.30617 type:complete len:83 (-) Transcript_15679:191-439(-)
MEMSESKLVDMSAMMSTFNQKVFEQEETVEGIMATEETARQYTADGVKEIQTAADRSKGQQIWILTLLLMASFSILFLDWYG